MDLIKGVEELERIEANVVRLERLWLRIESAMPDGVTFGTNEELERYSLSFEAIAKQLPAIHGYQPRFALLTGNEAAQMRFDANELGMVEAFVSVEEAIAQPGVELRKYRHLFDLRRRSLLRGHIIRLLNTISASLNAPQSAVDELRESIRNLSTLLGTSATRPAGWDEVVAITNDEEYLQALHRLWPEYRQDLEDQLYSEIEPVEVSVSDLEELIEVKTAPSTAVAKLNWRQINAEGLERLMYSLFSNEPTYENPEWLMHTNAPDSGRDLSVIRVRRDALTGTRRERILIQCRHQNAGVSLPEVAALKAQITMWEPPRIDELIIATTSRFTQGAVDYVERHNLESNALKITMWPESHLELLLSTRPDLITDFGLR